MRSFLYPFFGEKRNFLFQKQFCSNFRTGCVSSRLADLASLEDLLAALTSLGRDITGGELIQAVCVVQILII
jgi:hypothetical protein